MRKRENPDVPQALSSTSTHSDDRTRYPDNPVSAWPTYYPADLETRTRLVTRKVIPSKSDDTVPLKRVSELSGRLCSTLRLQTGVSDRVHVVEAFVPHPGNTEGALSYTTWIAVRVGETAVRTFMITSDVRPAPVDVLVNSSIYDEELHDPETPYAPLFQWIYDLAVTTGRA